MKILIIGARGFIGKKCFEYFSSKQKNVFGCDIQGSSNNENYFVISDNNPDFNSVFKKTNPDICINASGSADVAFSIKFPEKDFELNVQNVERILEAIKLNSPDCKLINFSSAAIYGNPKQLPIKESDPTSPLSPYGLHKLQSEQLLKKYWDDFGIKTCNMRIFSAYGPGLKKQIFWDIYQKSKNAKKVILYGTGKESRDFIYIDDLVKAIDLIIQNASFHGEAIHVANGEEININKAAQLLIDELHLNNSLYFSGEAHKGYPVNWKADISTLKKFGYQQSVSIEQGLKKYKKWLNEKE